MATHVKNIEKEFFLKVLLDKKLPVRHLRDRIEYILILDSIIKNEMQFRADKPIDKLKIKENIDLIFDYQEKEMVFNVQILHIKGKEITCTVPDFLYKNLDRHYPRVDAPSEMQIQFSFHGDRYNLSFPKVTEFNTGELGSFIEKTDPKNLAGLIDQMASWIKTCASGYRLVIFKDIKPSTVEECVVAQTGKTLYLPSTKGNFPQGDPYPRKRIITEDVFKRYLESTGVGTAFASSACARFVKAKADAGILSDAWIPILFHEYVIGYIHIWNNDVNKQPFNYLIIDNLYQFSKMLANSLEINGYFEEEKVKNALFEGRIVDISASGLLFSCSLSNLYSSLLPESNLTINISTPQKSISMKTTIVRRFKDNSFGYIGCQFLHLSREDFCFLFECIYGKTITDFDASFFASQV